MDNMDEFDPLAPPRRVQQEHESDSISESDVEAAPILQPEPASSKSEGKLEGTPVENSVATQANDSESRPEQRHGDTPPATSSIRKASVGSVTQKPAVEEDRPFDFQQFLDLMRTKQADPIARYIKSFLNEFHKKSWTAKEQVKIIADFKVFIAEKMKACPPFGTLDQRDWQNSQEGVEKLIMNRLYVRTFSPKMPPILRKDDHQEDLMRDKVFAEKLRLWGWIEPHHLDIQPQCFENESFLALACKQLNKINQFRAPRDKCICILNCSKVIWALIRSAKIDANADSFLPILIYVLLQAETAFLISNLNYINRFRGGNVGETAYYLSMVASAVAFIEQLDRSSLTIEDEEYQTKIEVAVAKEKQRPEQSVDDVSPGSHPPTSVLSASAGLLVESLKSYANKIFEPDDIDTPEARTPDPRAVENPEEAAAKQASAEEYQAKLTQEREFAQTLETLVQMFPTLDNEVIEDVLREKGARVGAAIDICLSLCE